MRRKTLDNYYNQGLRNGREGRPPNPVRLDRYLRMAYDAGWLEGQRQLDNYIDDLDKFINERITAGHRGVGVE